MHVPSPSINPQSRNSLTNVLFSMEHGLPWPNAQNSVNTRFMSASTLGTRILFFHPKSALFRGLISNPKFAAYAPVKFDGSANFTYSARVVPRARGPPTLATRSEISRNRSPRISPTMATASLNSSNVIRRSPRGFTLLNMISTLCESKVFPSCNRVSLQNLANLAPSIVSLRSSPRTPKLANSVNTSLRLASAPLPPLERLFRETDPRGVRWVAVGDRSDLTGDRNDFTGETRKESVSIGKLGKPPPSVSSLRAKSPALRRLDSASARMAS
mmetsp:Transcript_15553/g.51056  ORF Transcript_15553/g.51056 Transcript_15553/m.51056 type:complete len:272 (+) Transcript_15553:1970-2785(+)